MNRAHFLRTGAATAPAAGVAGTPLKLEPWMRQRGNPTPPYGSPSVFERGAVRTSTDWFTTARTPLAEQHGIITASGLCFTRNHAGIPQIDPRTHRLLVHGLTDRALVFSVDDVMRLPSVSRIHFIECSGNSGAEWHGPAGTTVAETHGLVSCCEWTGVPLSVLFDEVGIRPDARWFVAEGADGAAFDRSIPLENARDALLVYAQNGERLRPEQGFPLRLLIPGFEGSANVKWLRRLKLTREPVYSREETARYTDLMPDGRARAFTFVMEAKSVIVRPSGGQLLQTRGFHEIAGFAWSGRGRITGVDVSTDGGVRWSAARLSEPVLPKALTRFTLPWKWSGDEAVLQSRARDESGYVQPTRRQLVAARGTESYYHFNGIQSWRVATTGHVTNVQA